MLKYVGLKGLYPTSRRAQDPEGILYFCANRFHVEVLGILKTWFAQAVPIYDPWEIITYT